MWTRLLGKADGVARGMLLLTLGTLAGRAAGAIALPLLTRIYDPVAFGLLGVFSAIILVIAPVMAFYATAIPLPKRDRLALDVAVLSAMTIVVGLTIAALALAFAAEPILRILNVPQIAPYWPLLLLGLVGAGFYQILVQWGTRKRAFASIAWSSAMQSLLGSGAKIALGWLGFIPGGMLVGFVIQVSAGSIPLARRLARDALAVTFVPTRRGVRRAVRRFADFPLLRLPSQALMAFTGQGLMLFSAAMFDITVAGQIALAMSVLALPVAFLGRNIGQAYYGEIAAIGRKEPERIRDLTVAVVQRLVLVSTPVAILVFFAGRPAFEIAFGERWRMAGEIASISSIYIVASFASLPVVHALNVLGHQQYYLRINAIRAIWMSVLFGIAFAFPALDAIEVVAAYYLLLSIHLLLVLLRVMRLLGISPSDLVRRK